MAVKAGALRFNTDSNKLELYDGNQWTQIVATSPEAQTGGARGVIAGAVLQSPGTNKVVDIQYITVSTTGNSIDFGDLTQAINAPAGAASRTRATFAGGSAVPARQTRIEEVTIASTGDATNFGDLNTNRAESGGVSNGTRAIIAGGSGGSPVVDLSVIDYYDISSGGTANQFGELSDARERVSGNIMNSTRGIFYGGQSPAVNLIEFVTMSTLGNAADFGDLAESSINYSGASNSIRGIIQGGDTPASNDGLQYITISTLGNTVQFGEITTAREITSSVSSPTRMVVIGGYSGPSTRYNIMDYVQIMSTGNAVDFGDLTGTFSVGTSSQGACSNGHGGL